MAQIVGRGVRILVEDPDGNQVELNSERGTNHLAVNIVVDAARYADALKNLQEKIDEYVVEVSNAQPEQSSHFRDILGAVRQSGITVGATAGHLGQFATEALEAHRQQEISWTRTILGVVRAHGIERSPGLDSELLVKTLKRSRETLKKFLSPQQRKTLNISDSFIVTTPAGNRYKIDSSPVSNVKDLETGVCLCAAPAGDLPIYDQMLAQKIWLEVDEEGFWEAANVEESWI